MDYCVVECAIILSGATINTAEDVLLEKLNQSTGGTGVLAFDVVAVKRIDEDEVLEILRSASNATEH